LRASTLSAKSWRASSLNWKQPSVCWPDIAGLWGKKDGRGQDPNLFTNSGCSSASRRDPARYDYETSGSQRSSPSLSDQVLALATGKTQPEIAAACKRARPNHVGAAISRHKRAGRIEERDGKLYAT